MAESLAVELRDQCGTADNRRLRRAGKVPAVLYGHGLENVNLTVSAEALAATLRHGTRLVNLAGAVEESAFIRELQWDTWGTHVLHVDFTRISLDEEVEVTVSIELRGEAPGVREGGVVEQFIHDVEIACPAGSIPEKLRVNINQLKLEEKLTLAQLELPPGTRLLADDLEAVVVHCKQPAEETEETPAEAAPGEPEVIGAKKEEADEEE
ncbi:MAG: 50S ribosomal protein L25 [Pirellulales bacterium]|nr:50S ribosomal protein L25 [Pirellulales bacterium]